MKKVEAQEILRHEIARLRSMTYQELVGYLGPENVDSKEIAGESGTLCQVEIESMWDDEVDGDLRVMVAINSGGIRSFVPLTDDFIVAPDGTFVGEA